MEELDIYCLEIFCQEGALYFLFELREKIQISLLYATENDFGHTASPERGHKV